MYEIPDEYVEKVVEWIQAYTEEGPLYFQPFLRRHGLGDTRWKELMARPQVLEAFELCRAEMCIQWQKRLEQTLGQEITGHHSKAIFKYLGQWDREATRQRIEDAKELKREEIQNTAKYVADNYASWPLNGPNRAIFEANVNKRRSGAEA